MPEFPFWRGSSSRRPSASSSNDAPRRTQFPGTGSASQATRTSEDQAQPGRSFPASTPAQPAAQSPRVEPPTTQIPPASGETDRSPDEDAWSIVPEPTTRPTTHSHARHAAPTRETSDTDSPAPRPVHGRRAATPIPASPPKQPLAPTRGETSLPSTSGSEEAARDLGTAATHRSASTTEQPAQGRRRGKRALTSSSSAAEEKRPRWSASDNIGQTFPAAARFAPTPASATVASASSASAASASSASAASDPSTPSATSADRAPTTFPRASPSATSANRAPTTFPRASASASEAQTPGNARARRTHQRSAPDHPLRATNLFTVLSTLVPGAGLLSTRRRKLGRALVGLCALGLALGAAVGLWVWLGDGVSTLLPFLSQRFIIIAALIGLIAVTAAWATQIWVTSQTHIHERRLEGSQRTIAVVVAVCLMLAVVAPSVVAFRSLWATQRLLGSADVFGGGAGQHSGPDPWVAKKRVNVLLLGSDAGADRTGVRPDTIIIASIDTASGKTALFSIPRNLEHVRFPEGSAPAEQFPDGFRYFGRNQDLINAVWTWAEDFPDLFPGDTNPGLTATTLAVEETLGLSIDYYALVDLQGFQDLVNALGGVDMEVERRIPIGGGAAKIDGWIEPGQQTLDGYHALWYARSREGADDFNRMCRQQRVIREVTEEITPTTLATSIPSLVRATEDNISTDVSPRDVDAFVLLALRVKDGGITSYPITPEVTNPANADWGYLKEWAQASIDDSMTRQAEPEPTTDPGTTTASPSGAATPDDGAAATPSETPSNTPSETPSDTPTETPSDAPESTGDTADTSTPEPVIIEDPLASCMPGSDQSRYYQGQ